MALNNGPQIDIGVKTDATQSVRQVNQLDQSYERLIARLNEYQRKANAVFGRGSTPQAVQDILNRAPNGPRPTTQQFTAATQAIKTSNEAREAQLINVLERLNRRLNAPYEAQQRRQAAELRERNRFSNANQNVLGRIDSRGGAEFLQIQGAILRNFMLIGAAMQGITSGARFVVQLDAAFKQLQAITSTTATSMVALEEAIVSVSEKTKFTALEVAQAATILGQAGFSTKEIEDSIESITLLATATGSTLEKSVDVATSVLGVFNLQAAETSNVANVMTAAINNSKLTMDKLALGLQYSSNIAAQSGVSYEELTVALGALANAGIRSGSTLGTGLRQLLIDLQAPSAKLERRLTTLGLSLNDVDVKTNGLIGVMKNLRAAGFTSADAFETLEVRASTAFSAFSNNLEFANDFRTAIVGTNAAAKANEVQMQALANKLLQLGSVLGTLISKAAAPFIEVLKSMTDGAVKFFQAIDGGGPVVQTLLTSLLAFGALRFARTITRMTLGLISFTKAGQAAAAATGVLNARTAAAGAGMLATRAGILGVVGSIAGSGGLALILGAAATTMLALSDNTETAEERLDRLKSELDNVQQELDSTKTSSDAVAASIEMLTRRSQSLAEDDIMRGQVLSEVQQQFINLGLAIDTSADSTANVIEQLRELGRELDRGALQLAGEKLQAAQAVAREQRANVNNRDENAAALRKTFKSTQENIEDVFGSSYLFGDPEAQGKAFLNLNGKFNQNFEGQLSPAINQLVRVSGLQVENQKQLNEILRKSLVERSEISPGDLNQLLYELGQIEDPEATGTGPLIDLLKEIRADVQQVRSTDSNEVSALNEIEIAKLRNDDQVIDFRDAILEFQAKVQSEVSAAKELTDANERQQALFDILDRSSQDQAKLVERLSALSEELIGFSSDPQRTESAINSLNLRDAIAQAASPAVTASQAGQDNYFRNRKLDIDFESRGGRAELATQRRIAQLAQTQNEIDEAEQKSYEITINAYRAQKELIEEKGKRLDTDVTRELRALDAQFTEDNARIKADAESASKDLATRKNRSTQKVIRQVIQNIDNFLEQMIQDAEFNPDNPETKKMFETLIKEREIQANTLLDLENALAGIPNGSEELETRNRAQAGEIKLAEERVRQEWDKRTSAIAKAALVSQKRIFENQARDYERELTRTLKTASETSDRSIAEASLARAKTLQQQMAEAALNAFDNNPSNDMNTRDADVEAIKDARVRLEDRLASDWADDQKKFWDDFYSQVKSDTSASRRVASRQKSQIVKRIRLTIGEADDALTEEQGEAVVERLRELHARLKAAALKEFDANPDNVGPDRNGAQIAADRQELIDTLAERAKADIEQFTEAVTGNRKKAMRTRQRASTRRLSRLTKELSLITDDADEILDESEKELQRQRVSTLLRQISEERLKNYKLNPVQLDNDFDSADFDAGLDELEDLLIEDTAKFLKDFDDEFQRGVEERARTQANLLNRQAQLTQGRIANLKAELADTEDTTEVDRIKAEIDATMDVLIEQRVAAFKKAREAEGSTTTELDEEQLNQLKANLERDEELELKAADERAQKIVEGAARRQANLFNRKAQIIQGTISNLKSELSDAKTEEEVNRLKIEIDNALVELIEQRRQAFQQSRIAEGSTTPDLDQEQLDQLLGNLEDDRELEKKAAEERIERIKKDQLRIDEYFAKRKVKSIEDDIEAFLAKNEGVSEGQGLEEVLEKYQEMNARLIEAQLEAFDLDPDNNFLSPEDQEKLENAREDLRKGLINEALAVIRQILDGAGLSSKGVTEEDIEGGTAGIPDDIQQINDALEEYLRGAGRAKTTGELVRDGLSSLEGGFKDLFLSIADGSKSAGEAFKDFGRNMLATMVEVAASEAAKGFVRLLIGVVTGTPGGASGGGGFLPTLAQGIGSFFSTPAADGLYIPERGVGVPGKDSVPVMAMPGEQILSRKATRSLGSDLTQKLNKFGADALPVQPIPVTEMARGTKTETNVYVVSPEQKPVPGPNDIVAVITDDMARSGQTAKLIKQISTGG